MTSVIFNKAAESFRFSNKQQAPGPGLQQTGAPLSPADTPPDAHSPVLEHEQETDFAQPLDQYDAEDIAVVGMACRVAGDNNSPEELWDFLLKKGDASGEIPAMRWEPYYRRDARNAKILDQTTSRGYFVKNIEDFDSSFFGVTPREAEQMDPQQRISMEVCWEALESAGIPPQTLAKSNTAVFMGVNSDDWSKLLLEDIPGIEAWMGIGTAFCGIPNRISYHLDLMGPSTAVDAACASSLVAIHHGRQSLLLGETDLAIVGGVNAMCGPGLTRVLDKAGATSSEGRCRSFDDSSRGYGRGEGASVIILKRMRDAVRNNDHIHAVLKGSAVGQDGKTNGIMAPNGIAQQMVAETALKIAKIDPSTIGYVEAHATSTPVGDPVEVGAVANVYGKGRGAAPVYIGSIKPNIGHLEAGAGAMGFTKAVMALQKGIIPPQANLEKLNSKVNWVEAGVTVAREPTAWGGINGAPRRAGIASYGYGGTVSHAVLEEYIRNTPLPPPGNLDGEPSTILLLSAPQEKRLAVQAKVLADWLLGAGKSESLASIATTLSTRRGHFDNRAAFVVDSHEDAAAKLAAFAGGAKNAQAVSGRSLVDKANKEAVWVFSGHGAQWPDMGKELLSNAVFHDAISNIDDVVREEMGWSAIDKLSAGSFDSSDEIQVLTYVMQIGLAAVLKAKGLVPGAVIGHSIGEIAASVVGGALTAREGAIVVTRRAVLYRRVMGAGAMIMVHRPFGEVQAELGPRTDIAAAIDAAPTSCVVSGAKDVVAEFEGIWQSRGIKVQRVKSDVAFHSPVLNELVKPLIEVLGGSLNPRTPTIKIYSTSSASPRLVEPRDAQYWVNNMTGSVLLKAAISAAADDGKRVFLEVSTHPIVGHSIDETLGLRENEEHAVLPTMLRNKPVLPTMMTSIAKLHVAGVPIQWKALMPGSWSYQVPRTVWQHQPIWRTIGTAPANASVVHDVDKHTLLGERLTVAGETMVVYTTKLDDQTKPFPGSHPLHGSEIVPAAVLLNTFFHGTGLNMIEDIILRVPVAINAPRDIQIINNNGQARITSRLVQADRLESDVGSWVTHTTTRYSLTDASHEEVVEKIDIAAAKARIANQLASNFSIDYLDKVGVSAMGFPWAITEHWGTTTEMIARVDVAPGLAEGSALPWDAHSWSPIFDSATSVGSTLFFDEPRLRMPAHVEKVVKYSNLPPPKTGWLHVTKASGDWASNIDVCSDDGTVLARITAMRFSEIEGTPGISGSVESLVHQLAWAPMLPAEKALPIGEVIIVTQDGELQRQYERFFKKGYTVKSCATSADLDNLGLSEVKGKNAVIIYIPKPTVEFASIAADAGDHCEELLSIVKKTAALQPSAKVFAVTDDVAGAATYSALAQAPLQGLGRIIASEQPDLWGALIDTDHASSPISVIKYIKDCDIVQLSDGIARTARLRSLPRQQLLPTSKQGTLFPKASGTYIITGGLGALGLEVSSFLVEKGARRLVLLSRRALPPRKEWASATGSLAETLAAIEALESQGASVHVLSVDISHASAAKQLSDALDNLSLPKVSGVVHAAGVLEDQMVMNTTRDSFDRVLGPKITGALALHTLFPPGTLDFFMLFSSCGQLFGFPGQASYASGNAFLDTLSTYRRALGDNIVALQWTSWRSLGMAASTDFINAELQSKGITDITRDEAFRAWAHVDKYDVDNAVVLRSRAFDADEALPVPILQEIAVRRAPVVSADTPAGESKAEDGMPSSGPEAKAWLHVKIRDCVATTMGLASIDDVDPKTALDDLGLDSVMTVGLRRNLQTKLKVKVPPTLTWSHPTVEHLVGWFYEKLSSKD